MEWIRTKIKPAPKDVYVLLTNGTNVYVGRYDRSYDLFFDYVNEALPTPSHWCELPPPVNALVKDEDCIMDVTELEACIHGFVLGCKDCTTHAPEPDGSNPAKD